MLSFLSFLFLVAPLMLNIIWMFLRETGESNFSWRTPGMVILCLNGRTSDVSLDKIPWDLFVSYPSVMVTYKVLGLVGSRLRTHYRWWLYSPLPCQRPGSASSTCSGSCCWAGCECRTPDSSPGNRETIATVSNGRERKQMDVGGF